MADCAQLERVAEKECSTTKLPEDPRAVAGAYANAATHNAAHDDARSPSPTTVRTQPARADHSVSHVSLDYFDPSGVRELKRTMSRVSASANVTENSPEVPLRKIGTRSSAHTTTTLAAPKDDEPFDLEKQLRAFVKR